MRKSKPLAPEKKERLYVLLKESQTKSEFQRVQCLWLREVLELSSKEIALAIGWDASSVRRLQSKYLKEGEAALIVSARGGRHRENLSLEEEKELLGPFFEKSKAGGILIVKEIKLAYEDKVGGKVPKSTIYRMLARHGWRKVSPRPHHPQADPLKQEGFKKKLRK